MKNSVLTVITALLATSSAFAQEVVLPTVNTNTSTVLSTVYNPQFPGFMRLGILGGGGEGFGGTSAVGGVTLGVGRGMFGVETGVQYLHLAVNGALLVNDTQVSNEMTADYIGIPIAVKYNYIERPLASFYVKAGVRPMFLMSQSSKDVLIPNGSATTLVLNDSDLHMIGGIGGTAPLGTNSAFVLDINYFHGTAKTTDGGVVNSGVLVSAGVTWDFF